METRKNREKEQSFPRQFEEGTESVSLDRFRVSDDAIRLVFARRIHSEWRPAARFWASFELLDPSMIFDVRTDTSVLRQRLLNDLNNLKHAKVGCFEHVAEKVKAAVCWKLVGYIEWLRKSGSHEDMRDTQKRLSRMILLPPDAFFASPHADKEAVVLSQIISEDWVAAIMDSVVQLPIPMRRRF